MLTRWNLIFYIIVFHFFIYLSFSVACANESCVVQLMLLKIKIHTK
jgi:hypothetical protein